MQQKKEAIRKKPVFPVVESYSPPKGRDSSFFFIIFLLASFWLTTNGTCRRDRRSCSCWPRGTPSSPAQRPSPGSCSRQKVLQMIRNRFKWSLDGFAFVLWGSSSGSFSDSFSPCVLAQRNGSIRNSNAKKTTASEKLVELFAVIREEGKRTIPKQGIARRMNSNLRLLYLLFAFGSMTSSFWANHNNWSNHPAETSSED